MHGKIFQITTVKVDEDGRLTENTIEQGDGTNYDYCSEIDDEERLECISYLVNEILPAGMFELVSEDVLRYNGGIEEWTEKFIGNIRLKMEAITAENVYKFIGPVYQLEKELKNPLHTGYQFYMDEGGLQSYAEGSYEFMCAVSSMKPGTLLYIGGVIDYHF